jgi:hypothetical protein
LKIGKATEVDRCPASVPDHQEDGDDGDRALDQQPPPAGNAGRALLGHLGVVVEEAEEPEAQSDEEHHPDIDIGQIGPQQGADGDAGQEHQPAHGRRAGLLEDVALDAVLADRLALALLGLHPADEARAHGEDRELGGGEG